MPSLLEVTMPYSGRTEFYNPLRIESVAPADKGSYISFDKAARRDSSVHVSEAAEEVAARWSAAIGGLAKLMSPGAAETAGVLADISEAAKAAENALTSPPRHVGPGHPFAGNILGLMFGFGV